MEPEADDLSAVPERTCIVTRTPGAAEDLIRFVAGPDLSVVPDLQRKLPGRGCWVSAERGRVEEAARRNLFARALKAKVTPPADLGGVVDALLARRALGALGLARKAGRVVTGAAKVESAVRTGKAAFVLHALEAAADGVRKIDQARRAVTYADGPDIPAYKLFGEAEMSLALGTINVIHAAVLAGEAGRAVSGRVGALHRYRGGSPGQGLTEAAQAVPREAALETAAKEAE